LILLARIATIASFLLLALLPRETGTYMRMAGGCVIKPVGIERELEGALVLMMMRGSRGMIVSWSIEARGR